MTNKNKVDKISQAAKELECDESKATLKQKLETLTHKVEEDERALEIAAQSMIEDEQALMQAEKMSAEVERRK